MLAGGVIQNFRFMTRVFFVQVFSVGFFTEESTNLVRQSPIFWANANSNWELNSLQFWISCEHEMHSQANSWFLSLACAILCTPSSERYQRISSTAFFTDPNVGQKTLAPHFSLDFNGSSSITNHSYRSPADPGRSWWPRKSLRWCEALQLFSTGKATEVLVSSVAGALPPGHWRMGLELMVTWQKGKAVGWAWRSGSSKKRSWEILWNTMTYWEWVALRHSPNPYIDSWQGLWFFTFQMGYWYFNIVKSFTKLVWMWWMDKKHGNEGD